MKTMKKFKKYMCITKPSEGSFFEEGVSYEGYQVRKNHLSLKGYGDVEYFRNKKHFILDPEYEE